MALIKPFSAILIGKQLLSAKIGTATNKGNHQQMPSHNHTMNQIYPDRDKAIQKHVCIINIAYNCFENSTEK